MLKTEKNSAISEKFNALYPGGQTNFRVSLEATKHRIFITRTEGAHMWDVDGNEFIDYQGAFGPSILGYRHPEYIAALKDMLDTAGTCSGSGLFHNPIDVEVAELLVKHVPCGNA